MPTQAEIYGYGTVSNVICCICSLAGAFVIPFSKKHKTAYNVVLSIFMGLAVGALASDALLHLIPEALGLHSHERKSVNKSNPESSHRHRHTKRDTHHVGHDHHHHDESLHNHSEDKLNIVVHLGEEFHVEPYMWYCMVLLLGAYVFYLVEMVMVYIQKMYKNGQDPVILTAFNNQPINLNGFLPKKENNDSSESGESLKGVSPIVVMIVVGDAIHNFTDGLAVAAAFSSSILEGVSITIAIFCHELPQELGDFAILIKGGLSFNKALLANLFSSLTAFVGFYIGVPISSEESSRQWIFAITAGMFIYISFVEMVPLLIKNGSTGIKTILFHNIGILFGATVIILLGIYESQIEI